MNQIIKEYKVENLAFGYFGPSFYDCLEINVYAEISALRIMCNNQTPDYLNLQGIYFTDDSGIIPYGSLKNITLKQSSIYSKNSDSDPHAILLGKGVHTLKEQQPTLEILFAKPIYVEQIKILNRPDFWGKRSQTLRVETKGLGPNAWHLAKDLNSESHRTEVLAKIKLAISRLLPEFGDKDINDASEITRLLASALRTSKISINEVPWPVLIKLTDVWAGKATPEQSIITAAYLVAQKALGFKPSISSLIQPFLSEDIVLLKEDTDFLSKQNAVETIDFEELLATASSKSREKNAWLDLEKFSQALVMLSPKNYCYFYNLALAHEKRGKNDKAKKFYSIALDLDPRTNNLHTSLFKSTHEAMECRVELASFIQENFSKIKSRALEFKPRTKSTTYKIFSYWAQGLNHAPPIVKACHRQLYLHHKPEDIVYLDDTNYRYYVDIPEQTIRAIAHNKTFFSDVLRFYLLSEYGGTWVDSTCYLTAPLDIEFDSIENKRITAFRTSNKNRISVWFFSASQSSYIIKMIRESLTLYWQTYDSVIDYYILHHIFEILYFIDPSFRDEWDNQEQPRTSEAHRWYYKLSEKFTKNDFDIICASSNIHKLTYKVDKNILNSDNFYSYAIRGF